MAGIQSSINSAIGNVGFILNMSGALKKHGDMAALKKQEGQVNKQIKARVEMARQEGFKADEAWHQQGLELAQKHEAVMKQKFDLDPSKANLDNYVFSKGTTNKYRENLTNYQNQNKLTSEQATQRATQHMQNAQQERRTREGVAIYGAHGEVINDQK